LDRKLNEIKKSVTGFVAERIHTLLFLAGIVIIDVTIYRWNATAGWLLLGGSLMVLGILTDHKGDDPEKR
jgi:uncharacterized membrane protein SirB2